jgi:hypothetical protein
MGIFNQLGNFFKPKSEHDKLLTMVEKMIVKGYRRIGKERGKAPSKKTSDKKIIEIYCRIAGAFKDAAKQRNEKLPEGYINYLVFYFLNLHENYCSGGSKDETIFEMQLDFEIKRYLKEGLRKELQRDLQIFETEQYD